LEWLVNAVMCEHSVTTPTQHSLYVSKIGQTLVPPRVNVPLNLNFARRTVQGQGCIYYTGDFVRHVYYTGGHLVSDSSFSLCHSKFTRDSYDQKI